MFCPAVVISELGQVDRGKVNAGLVIQKNEPGTSQNAYTCRIQETKE